MSSRSSNKSSGFASGGPITVESVSADATTAKLLQIRAGAPLLLLHRLTHLQDGTPFDLETVRYRGDRCSLVTTASRGTVAPPP